MWANYGTNNISETDRGSIPEARNYYNYELEKVIEVYAMAEEWHILLPILILQ
jgi:hypothetical protein